MNKITRINIIIKSIIVFIIISYIIFIKIIQKKRFIKPHVLVRCLGQPESYVKQMWKWR